MRIIKLKPNGTGRYDDVSPFIVTDNRLELQIELPSFNGEFFFVYENNEKTDKRLLFPSGQIVIDNLSGGEFRAAVKHYIKGELVKVYTVEPLLLKEVDDVLSALPEIEALRRDISLIERTFEEYRQSAAERESEREKTFDERLKNMETNLLSLLSFAFKDYKDNVYLGGGDFTTFTKEFGFELSDEQINNIKGETGND